MKKSLGLVQSARNNNNNNMATTKTAKNHAEETENKTVGLRKSKLDAIVNRTKALVNNQRAPLGAIAHNNQLAGKKQAQENATCRMGLKETQPEKPPVVQAQRKPGTFTIHHDDGEAASASENHVTTVKVEHPTPKDAVARQPLSTLSSNADNLKDSPMVIDLSISLDSATKKSEDKSTPTSHIREDLLVPEYADDVYTYLRQVETRFQARPTYMSKQPDITSGMRSILIDWLVEVVEEYKLQTETLYLAVGYIDRFLSYMSVLRGKLQLVGTASMFIASKFEEIYPPDVCEFVYITDDTYTKKQVLRMEQIILRVLSFDLAAPTPYYFLQLYFHVGKREEKCRHLALYLCELSLLEADPYLLFAPSILAGAAVCLAGHTLDQTPWGEELEEFTGYSIEDFSTCLTSLHKSFANAANFPQQAIREKYRSSKYSEIANIPPPITQLS